MRKVNSKLVGAFVLGAIALFMAAIVVFGKGHFFRPTMPCCDVLHRIGEGAAGRLGNHLSRRDVGQVNDIELSTMPRTRKSTFPSPRCMETY